jgi:transketolase
VSTPSAPPVDGVLRFDCRDATVAKLEALAAGDDRVCAVVNDSVGSSKLGQFAKHFPDRLVNVGIAEQNMIGVAAGLANGGMIPFVFGASCFLTARALEQIKVDLAYSGANVKVVGVSSGVAYGELGPTHHSIEDLAWLRAISDLHVVVPADPYATACAVDDAFRTDGPFFIRTSRIPVPAIHDEGSGLPLGRAVQLRDGNDVTIIANGVTVGLALDAAAELAAGSVSARVLDLAWIAPFDAAAVAAAAIETGAIVTVEEAVRTGGLGGAVAEIVADVHPVPVQRLGFDGFAPTGSAAWLLDRSGLHAGGIADAARSVLARKARR